MAWILDLRDLSQTVRDVIPLLAVLAVSVLGLPAVDAALRARARRRRVSVGMGRPLVMLALTALAISAAILTLPVAESTRDRLLALLGLLLTAVITFSSTSLVANAMAGVMLRAVGNFRVGDFVRVGQEFGRVTERGLFHTEIQTEDRDLATLPNLYLATQPVTVVRASGTIVSATVSLGYDRHHVEVESLLVEAARQAGLDEPFAQVLELGDFSVRYRVAGFLSEVKTLLSARSRLRTAMLDVLHGAGVEIVSPTFMNQRRLAEGARAVPLAPAEELPAAESAPEERIFDKAEQAAARERAALQAETRALEEEIAELERARERSEDDARREELDGEIERRRARLEEMVQAMAPPQAPTS